MIRIKVRVYDPKIGRFMSADPFIQSPMNSQSFNRHSDVLNNPLSLVDPSGYISASVKSNGQRVTKSLSTKLGSM